MKILQISPPRTGSTKMWNILKMAYGNDVSKYHIFDVDNAFNIPIVMTVRNPYDMVCSSILRYGQQITDQSVSEQIMEISEFGLDVPMRFINDDNVLIFRYEDYIFDWDFTFNKLEEFLGEIDESKKKEIVEKLEIKNIKNNIMNTMDSFSQYDKKTHIHGKHISEFNGEVGYSKKLLSKHQIQMIKTSFKEYNKTFNYE